MREGECSGKQQACEVDDVCTQSVAVLIRDWASVAGVDEGCGGAPEVLGPSPNLAALRSILWLDGGMSRASRMGLFVKTRELWTRG